MKAKYYGIITLVLWIVGMWSAYFLNIQYQDGTLNFLTIITTLLISSYPIAMYLCESDIGTIDELKKENESLKEKLKKKP